METYKRLYIVALSLLIAVLMFWGLGAWIRGQKNAAGKEQQQAQQTQNALVRDHSPVLGEPSARVTIVEFLDPECESCRAMYSSVKEILAAHPNDVRLVIRYVPFHKNSQFAIRLLEALKVQNKYWDGLEKFFDSQPIWGDHHNPKPEHLWSVLRDMGVDVALVQKSFSDPKTNDIIVQDMTDAQLLEVKATPTFFVNGKIVLDFGDVPLKAAVQEALSELQ